MRWLRSRSRIRKESALWCQRSSLQDDGYLRALTPGQEEQHYPRLTTATLSGWNKAFLGEP